MGKQLLLAVLLASGIPPLAHAQSGPNGDELRATMRVLAPDASDADPIYRKIPPRKSKKPGVDDDAPAKDLANPGGHDDDSGSAGDPGPLDPGPVADPETPVDSPIPPDPIIPAAPDPRDVPGDFGHGVADDARHHGEDARRHEEQKPKHDDKPPRGPASKPPEPKSPEHKPPGQQPRDPPRDHQPPGQKPRDPPRDHEPPKPRDPPRDRQPPRDAPRDHQPPGHEPREPPRGPGDKPRKPRE